MIEGLDQVRGDLAQAGNAQLARIVAVVDALPARGRVDDLIAPLRHRLAQIRPPRPRSVMRLLFVPVEPVIMPLDEWRSVGIGIPRPAVGTLGRALRDAMLAEGTWPGEGPADESAGAVIWPAAARTLQRLALPPDWEDRTGLHAAEFQVVTATLGGVLQDAVVIEEICQAASPNQASIRGALISAQTRGSAGLDTAVAILLARTGSSRVASIATEIAGGEATVDLALTRMVSSMAQQAKAGAGREGIAATATRLAEVIGPMAHGASPAQLARLNGTRKQAEALCRETFRDAARETIASISAPSASPGPAEEEDEAADAMEAMARDVRRLELAGRKLGGNTEYESILAKAVDAVHANPGQLATIERVRLLEILAGPETAMRLLNGEDPN